MDLGAVFISMTCAKQGINMSNILQGLLPLIDKMIERGVSVEQADVWKLFSDGQGVWCFDESAAVLHSLHHQRTNS